MQRQYEGRVELRGGTFETVRVTASDLMHARAMMESMHPGKKVFSVQEAR